MGNSDSEASNKESSVREALRQWRRPPRSFDDVVEDRVVSFLELFYDLVFVVLVAQIAHTLAGDISWAGVARFAIVFVLIWFAWMNGTIYHEIHGGDDGRSRTYIFFQMTVLAVLSAYAPHAADSVDDGRGFALAYSVLLSIMIWQWWQVGVHDAPEVRRQVTLLIGSLSAVTVILVASAAIDEPALRLWMWAGAIGLSAAFVGTQVFLGNDQSPSLAATESLVERFGLFTIIVLGEVVVGVVDGLGDSERGVMALLTAVLAINVGFGLWWSYFDLVGRKSPRSGSRITTLWTYAHLPMALSIAALGAGMVSFIEHASDGRTGSGTAWLFGGSLAVALVAIAVLLLTLEPHPGRKAAPISLLVVAAFSLVLSQLRPAPWLFALLLFAALTALWLEVFVRHARNGTSIASSDL